MIKEILADAGVDDKVEWRLRSTYAPRDFLCQYRETEMNFVHRLLEDEGIFTSSTIPSRGTLSCSPTIRPPSWRRTA